MLEKIIRFDINKNLYETLTAKQGDTESRFLLFQLLDGAVPFSLENRSVRVYAIKPDGTEIFNELIVEDTLNGYCTLELTTQMLAVAGIVKLELMVTEGYKKLTSNIFQMVVNESINSEKAVVSTNEFGTLLTALSSLNEYDNYKKEITAARDGETNLLTKVKKIDKQLEVKADLSELEIERERINNLARLEAGSTTGDAELMDGRIGADGVTYSNIGSAIRTQFNNITNRVGGEKLIGISFEKIPNSYVEQTTGAIKPYDGWSRSDMTEIHDCTQILINGAFGVSNYNCFYDSNQEYIPRSNFTINAGQTIIDVPEGAKYFIISHTTENIDLISVKGIKSELGTIDIIINALVEKIDVLENKLKDNTLKVMTYNVGKFNNGSSYVPDNSIEEYAVHFRKLFGKQNADILNTQEFDQYFNVSQDVESIPLITDQIYKYNTSNLNYGYMVFSQKALNNPVSINFTSGGRGYIKSFINVNGKEVCILNAHTNPEVDFTINRQSQFNQLLDEMNNHEYVILSGDFNTFSKDEFDVFKNAGYKLANGGDFGWFETWHNCGKPNNVWTNGAIDNIIVSSNISIQNVEMIDGQLSDHAPLVAQLKIN